MTQGTSKKLQQQSASCNCHNTSNNGQQQPTSSKNNSSSSNNNAFLANLPSMLSSAFWAHFKDKFMYCQTKEISKAAKREKSLTTTA